MILIVQYLLKKKNLIGNDLVKIEYFIKEAFLLLIKLIVLNTKLNLKINNDLNINDLKKKKQNFKTKRTQTL